LGAPIQVLQTGDEVRDIVNMAAVAVLDAAEREKRTDQKKSVQKAKNADKVSVKPNGKANR